MEPEIHIRMLKISEAGTKRLISKIAGAAQRTRWVALSVAYGGLSVDEPTCTGLFHRAGTLQIALRCPEAPTPNISLQAARTAHASKGPSLQGARTLQT